MEGRTYTAETAQKMRLIKQLLNEVNIEYEDFLDSVKSAKEKAETCDIPSSLFNYGIAAGALSKLDFIYRVVHDLPEVTHKESEEIRNKVEEISGKLKELQREITDILKNKCGCKIK